MYACTLLTQTQMYTHKTATVHSRTRWRYCKCPSDPHISLSRVHMKAFTNAAGCEAQPQSRILKIWEGNKGWWNAFIFLKLVNKEDKDSHLQKKSIFKSLCSLNCVNVNTHFFLSYWLALNPSVYMVLFISMTFYT